MNGFRCEARQNPAARVLAITCSTPLSPSSPTRNPYRMPSNLARLLEHSLGAIR